MGEIAGAWRAPDVAPKTSKWASFLRKLCDFEIAAETPLKGSRNLKTANNLFWNHFFAKGKGVVIGEVGKLPFYVAAAGILWGITLGSNTLSRFCAVARRQRF